MAPNGFGKGVNDYLNEYVKIADAKATAFLAGNLTTVTLVLRLNPQTTLPQYLRWASLAVLAWSIFECGAVLFPRTPRGRMGTIFWEDIRLHKMPSAYEQEVAAMDEKAVESEYAAQNWFVSGVLQCKFRRMQRVVILFFIGVGAAIGCYLAMS